jgi:hypothetical protein
MPTLKDKYPTSKRDPKPDCSRCDGKGEIWIRSVFRKDNHHHWSPCACIYIDPDVVEFCMPHLEKAFKDVLGNGG